jgi:hypothetical protein
MRSGLQRSWKGSSIKALDFWTGITLNKRIKLLQLKPVRPTPTAGSLLGSADAGGDDMDGLGASHQPGAGGDIIDDAYSHSSVSRSGRLSWILSLVWKLVEKMFEWFGVPLARFILPPPHMEIERRLSYCGRHNTETGPFGLFIRMRFFNKSGRATVVESIQLFFAGTEGDPRRDGPYSLLTKQGWVIDGFLSREDNILVTRDVPPMKEVERFSYLESIKNLGVRPPWVPPPAADLDTIA